MVCNWLWSAVIWNSTIIAPTTNKLVIRYFILLRGPWHKKQTNFKLWQGLNGNRDISLNAALAWQRSEVDLDGLPPSRQADGGEEATLRHRRLHTTQKPPVAGEKHLKQYQQIIHKYTAFTIFLSIWK